MQDLYNEISSSDTDEDEDIAATAQPTDDPQKKEEQPKERLSPDRSSANAVKKVVSDED